MLTAECWGEAWGRGDPRQMAGGLMETAFGVQHGQELPLAAGWVVGGWWCQAQPRTGAGVSGLRFGREPAFGLL